MKMEKVSIVESMAISEVTALFNDLETLWVKALCVFEMLLNCNNCSQAWHDNFAILITSNDLVTTLVDSAELLGLLTDKENRLARRIVVEIAEVIDAINYQLEEPNWETKSVN